jgi:glycosyltransferase involved in cell wall biosynthesis
LKILLLHTNYSLKGGEDKVFEQERDLLMENHEVQTLVMQNLRGVRGLIQFIFSIWNISAATKLRKIINDFNPDLVHIHNLHFAMGPLVIRVCHNRNIPIVMTLHNYRLLCPSASLQYKGLIFTDSLKTSFPWKAVRLGVYRDSILQTFWLAFTTWIHKKTGTWKKVTLYVVLTDFAKELILNPFLGFRDSQIIVKPNFIKRTSKKFHIRGEHFLFVGRLTEEKGIPILLNAIRKTGIKVHIAGDGPFAGEIIKMAEINKNITWLGSLEKQEVLQAMEICSALIFPSTWYEGMPMTIIEAFSTSTPVIASNIGAMSTMVQHNYNGMHFESGNIHNLIDTLSRWTSETNSVDKQQFYQNALNTYLKFYTPERNLTLLENIYEKALVPNDQTQSRLLKNQPVSNHSTLQ